MITKSILGVPFFTGSPTEAVVNGMRGGLVVVPAAPALVDLETSPSYRRALLGADFAIADSGFMVLLWWIYRGEKLTRVSGLEYLNVLLQRVDLREPGSVFWVMPTASARDLNLAWLRNQGFPTTENDCYIAPQYGDGDLRDELLLAVIRERRPKQIIVALGGGVQERLGFYLKLSVEYRPGIHCIGAAIGFLSGEQVRIPMWVDYLYLGWLWRSVSAPKKFVPRYWKARRLVGVMWRWRDKAPDIVDSGS